MRGRRPFSRRAQGLDEPERGGPLARKMLGLRLEPLGHADGVVVVTAHSERVGRASELKSRETSTADVVL